MSPPKPSPVSPLAQSLAMDAAAARRAAEASLQPRGQLIAFSPDRSRHEPLQLMQVARLYLSTPHAPAGLVKSLARQHGHDYGQLLRAIATLQHSQRFPL